MLAHLRSLLSAVRYRQRWALGLRAMVIGALAGSIFVLLVELIRRTTGLWDSPWPQLVMIVGIPAATLAFTLLRRPSWRVAAAAVDRHYRLKDRTSSALQFLSQPQLTVVQQLQVADAVQALERLRADQVVPLRAPRYLQSALLLVAVATVLALLPLRGSDVQAVPPEAIPGIVAEAASIQEQIEDLDDLAQENEDEQLEQLVEDLRETAEAMEAEEVDVPEALAKLSQMQQAIMHVQAQFNVALVDQHLANVGQALALAAPLKQVGKALQEAKHEEASAMLQAPMPPLPRRAAHAVKQQLERIAEAMQQAGLGALGQATSELGDGIGGGRSAAGRPTANRFARLVKRHAHRRRANQMLRRQLTRLGESKRRCLMSRKPGACSACRGAGCAACRSGVGGNPSASDRPSNKWGTAVAGNIDGPPTGIAAQRFELPVTGQMGDGPSDVEIESAPEGRQRAARTYRDVYREYRKLSDAVLESEPLPLGHRQTIKRYFELIRPAAGEDGQ